MAARLQCFRLAPRLYQFSYTENSRRTMEKRHGVDESGTGVLSSDSSAIVELERKGLPNGGLKAWLQILGAFFLYFNTWGKHSL